MKKTISKVVLARRAKRGDVIRFNGLWHEVRSNIELWGVSEIETVEGPTLRVFGEAVLEKRQ